MEIHDLNYYQLLIDNVNKNYQKNILGDLNYSYTTQGVVSPITGNEIVNGADPISGHNNVSLEDRNFTNITELASFQSTFLSQTKTNLQNTNSEINNFVLNTFGVPAGDGLADMVHNLNFNPNSEMLKYLGEWSPEVQAKIDSLNLEFNQNQVSMAIINREQSFINGLGVENTFNKLGAAEKEIFMQVLNSYDELVTNYQSEAQNSGIRHLHGQIPEDGLIGEAFSDVNVAAMKLNKAKDMLTMLSEGMSAKDIKVYEKTYDYEIEFNNKLADAVKEHGVGSPEANLLSAQAEASRRTRLYVESVHTMKTSTDNLDKAVVAQWERDGYNPLAASIITDMESDIINNSSLSSLQSLYQGDDSKYSLATDNIKSIRERALEITNINRDGRVSTTEIAVLLTDAYANGNKVDGISLDVLKAALAANGVTTAQISSVETTIDQVDTNNDGKMDFNEALVRFNSFQASQGKAAFDAMMNVLAATQVDEASNPDAFVQIGNESFFVGDYSSQDKAVLSTFLASNGRYVHTTEEKFEALDAFHDNAGDTRQQRSDWRDYLYANWAQTHAQGDISQDNSLAWSFKNGLNVSSFLEEMQEMTNSRTDMMTDALEYGDTRGADWWSDFSLSYFEVIRDESNVFLVGQRGGSEQDLRLMDMIGEALQISYADYGNYHTGINVNIDAVQDNVSGADKVQLKYFADNLDSFGTTDITYDKNLVDQSLQQYYAMWGLRAGLHSNINKISEPEAKLIENRFGQLMDIGDQMEAYLMQNKGLGADAKETDAYRALEEQWFNNYDLINGIIRGDTSIDKAVTALGGIGADGSVSAINISNLIEDLQEAIVEGADSSELDFNSDGAVDSADYDVLRMVVGDRRNESAFDALMTQDSLNLSKMSMYSGLAKNTQNVNQTDRAIYSQLETYFSDQSEINNYIASNLTGSNFASAAAEQEFKRLANSLDELNEAVEFKIREKLYTGTSATLDSDLLAQANKASNQMLLLSLGFTKEESAAISDSFGPSFKITEELTDDTEMILKFAKGLKDKGDLDINDLSTIAKLVIEENPDNLADSEIINRFGVLADYIRLGANEAEISTYMGLVIENAPEDKFNLLDHYIRGGDAYGLSSNQESTFLEYLRESNNGNIARSYLNFVRDGASESSFKTLDDIFTRAGSAREVLTESDLRFGETLNTLSRTYKLSGNYYDKILDNFDTVPVDHLNSVLDKIVELNENSSSASQAKIQSIDLMTALISVVQDPSRALFNTDLNNAQAIFMNSSLGKNADITKEILESQLLLLNGMSQADPVVIAAKEKTSMMLGWIPDYLSNPDPETDNLDSKEKGIYDTFLKSFPAGRSPTQAQKDAALELIDGNYVLGDNVAFMASYSKLVAAGDDASALKLAEIAKFYGDGAISSYTKLISNANISAETVDAAHSALGLIKEMQEKNPTGFKGVIEGNASNFLLKTLLDGKGGYNAGEGAEAKAFLESLRDALDDQPNTMTDSAMGVFIHTSLREFDRDLSRNGAIFFSSRTEVIAKNKAAQSTFNQDTAEIQINIFQSMINFYNSQITQENAKAEPDTAKIAQLTAQINSHRSAITALEKITN